MIVRVPPWARREFWDDPPPGSWEFWAFKLKPTCRLGETILFVFGRDTVARAVLDRIEPPGESACDRTGRFVNCWKVFWHPHSFVDLRPPRPEREAAAAPAPQPKQGRLF